MRPAEPGRVHDKDLRGVESDPEAEATLDERVGEIRAYCTTHNEGEVYRYVQTFVRCAKERLRRWLRRQPWHKGMISQKRAHQARHPAFVTDGVGAKELAATEWEDRGLETTASKHPVRRWEAFSDAERREVEAKLRGWVKAGVAR